MEATRADIERVASHLAARSRFIETVIHGRMEWFVEVDGALVPADVDVDLIDGGLMIHFYIGNPPATTNTWPIFAGDELMRVYNGSIVAGKPARLKLWFAGEPAPCSV